MDSPRQLPNLVPASGDPAQHIHRDVACLSCGYNLRGSDMSATCPACGTPVNQSIYGALAQYGDQHWLQSLARGVYWLLISFALWPLVPIIFAMIRAGSTITLSYSVFQAAWGLSVTAPGLIGTWFMTRRPPIDEEPKRHDTRIVARWALVAADATYLFSLGIYVAYAAHSKSFDIMCGIISLIAEFTFLGYLAQLALLATDASLAKSTTIVKWGTLCVWLLDLAWELFAPAGGAISTSPQASILDVAASTAGCVMVVGLLVFGIWFLVLLIRYRQRFRAALAVAR